MHEPCEYRLVLTSTIPSSVCCLQFAAILLPLTLNVDTFVQEPCEQRLRKNIHHTVLRMMLAERRRLAALDVKGRLCRARVV